MDWSSFSIGNAAGFIKGPGKLFDEILRSAATDITVGSITLGAREGNPGDVYLHLADGTSVNALGLPNPGLDAILRHAEDMERCAQQAGKRLRWSIAGFSPAENAELAQGLYPFGDIEVNLGCPNVWADGEQKDIPSFNLKLMQEVLESIASRIQTRFDVKVSPYSNPAQLAEVAQLIASMPFIRHVVTSNTFPNGYGGRDMPNGYGGVGGNALFVPAMGQVSQFAGHLDGKKNAQVIGVGGISDGARAAAMRSVGAAGIQVGTAFGEHGARIFSDILAEAVEAPI